jgi:hypothetical protein
MTGRFNAEGHSHVTLLRKGLGSLTVDLTIDPITGTNLAVGTVTSSNWLADITAYRARSTNETHSTAQFTMALESLGSGTPMPSGWSVGTLTQAVSGVITATGYLADNTPYSAQPIGISSDGYWPMFAQLYKNPNGMLWGWLQFKDTAEPQITGTVAWFRPPGLANHAYPAGFAATLSAIGSRYTNASPYLGWSTGSAALFDNQCCTVTNNITLSSNIISVVNDFHNPATNKLVLNINNKTGLIAGHFQNPCSKTTNIIRGVFLQNQGIGVGYFNNTNAGALLLQSQ